MPKAKPNKQPAPTGIGDFPGDSHPVTQSDYTPPPKAKSKQPAASDPIECSLEFAGERYPVTCVDLSVGPIAPPVRDPVAADLYAALAEILRSYVVENLPR